MALIKQCFKPALISFVAFAILTGVIYTGFITGISQAFFPEQSNGSVVVGKDGKKYSMLLGQTFTQDIYMWGRIQDYDFSIPSTHPDHENSDTIPNSHGKVLMYSWASNLSPAGQKNADTIPQVGAKAGEDPLEANPDFDALMAELVAERVERIHDANARHGLEHLNNIPIPVALVTNSGSGLDPHIPTAAAEYQIPRVAAARGISEQAVRDAINKSKIGKTFGVFGEEVVNVLQVNLILDGILD